MATSETVDYHVIGLMSGTSLDGLDMAYCRFTCLPDRWDFSIVAGETHPYTGEWLKKLAGAHTLSAADLSKLNFEFGRYSGELARAFVDRQNLKPPDFIASHGHTVFHAPAKGYTLQIGHGAALSAACSLPVYADFRSTDVALGGQGAPLVPAGDKLLFGSYKACVNLGGIANISFEQEGRRIAADICPCNLILNKAARDRGFQYDDGGAMAAAGRVDHGLLTALDELEYYDSKGPKSMGREWVEKNIDPLLQLFSITPDDLAATFSHHIGNQVYRYLESHGLDSASASILFTGGGVNNLHLMQEIRKDLWRPSPSPTG